MFESLHLKLRVIVLLMILCTLGLNVGYILGTVFYFSDAPQISDYTRERYTFVIFSMINWFVIFTGTLVVYAQYKNNKRDPNFIRLYRIFNWFLLGFLFNTVVLTIMIRFEPSDQLRNDLNDTVHNYPSNQSPFDLNKLQEEMKCCGFDSIEDFIEPNDVKSCCDSSETACNEKNSYPGCWSVYLEKLKHYKTVWFSLNGASGALQLIGSCLMFYLTFHFV